MAGGDDRTERPTGPGNDIAFVDRCEGQGSPGNIRHIHSHYLNEKRLFPHGSEGILRFTEGKTVTAQHLLPFGSAFGMSDGAHSRLLTSLLRALKAAGKK